MMKKPDISKVKTSRQAVIFFNKVISDGNLSPRKFSKYSIEDLENVRDLLKYNRVKEKGSDVYRRVFKIDEVKILDKAITSKQVKIDLAGKSASAKRMETRARLNALQPTYQAMEDLKTLGKKYKDKIKEIKKMTGVIGEDNKILMYGDIPTEKLLETDMFDFVETGIEEYFDSFGVGYTGGKKKTKAQLEMELMQEYQDALNMLENFNYNESYNKAYNYIALGLGEMTYDRGFLRQMFDSVTNSSKKEDIVNMEKLKALLGELNINELYKLEDLVKSQDFKKIWASDSKITMAASMSYRLDALVKILEQKTGVQFKTKKTGKYSYEVVGRIDKPVFHGNEYNWNNYI